ncbi:ATP-dependent zinc metalloprotease FtsH [Smittium mucronatum]|uniref:ATP-dependent zinc metalloprotease FtsH n=1 Tax=Smittium mucronatum TaxID=133383 RepID=A0A1R0GLN9_9FUNG|nr:ATP-dependent zinc metalloprotease FtsH [Smittium mucronatum]
MVISSSDFVKAEIGRSEKAISNVFETAKKTAPTIIFIDELESLFGNYEGSGNLTKKMVSQLLMEIDILRDGDFKVIVLAATNALDLVSSDLTQSGRMDMKIYIPAPSYEERIEIFTVLTRNYDLNKVDFKKIAVKTAEFTGAEISSVVRSACLIALARSRSLESQLSNLGISEGNKEKDQSFNEKIELVQSDFYSAIEKVLLFK